MRLDQKFGSLESLEGSKIILRPLVEADTSALFKTLYSPTTWSVVERGIANEEAFVRYIKDFLDKQSREESVTLVARVKETSELVAISTFWNLAPNKTKVEIGFTWVCDKFMRTFVNTEMKFLMLSYAFETLKVKRVEFSVDPRNEKSNNAMKRLGAVHEGTLRKWRFLSASDRGDRNIYSIIDDEWAEKKKIIIKKLMR